MRDYKGGTYFLRKRGEIVGKQGKRIGIVIALLSAACGWRTVSAAADAEVYELNPITVTASRYEKKDLDVPASTQVMTGEQIRRSGAKNLQQALMSLDNIVYHQKGPGGAALSSMTSEIVIRGVEGGTLVLVNGTPINWRGHYNLEDIPADIVERVEVVRGGGSVLYGSQATGGVINIITKDKMPNEVSVGIGNYGQQNYHVSVNADKLSVAYNYDKWGSVGYVSSTLSPESPSSTKEMKNKFTGSEKNYFLLNYRFNEYVDVLYNHDDSWSRWKYDFGQNYAVNGQTRYQRLYTRGKDFVQMNFKDKKGITGHLYFNQNTLAARGTDYYSSTGKLLTALSPTDNKETNTDYGYDVQKVWKGSLQTFLLGTSYDKEKFRNDNHVLPSQSRDYARNDFSAFGQWDRPLTKKDRFTMSARETWTTGAAESKNYTNFSGQAQYLHKLNADQSWYMSVGQSFVMPSFSNMYSTGVGSIIVGNPNLKPQEGVHVEAGWKINQNNRQYRVAVFTTHIKDNITFAQSNGKYYAQNQDFRNTGVEAGVTVVGQHGWSWNYGVAYGNPQSKYSSQNVSTKNYWDRIFGRWQMNGGVSYQKEKWTATLSGTYLADRVLQPSSSHSVSVKPYLLTSFSVDYAPDKSSTISLSLDNILDRDDNVNYSSGAFYSTPFNYLLSYKYKF